MKAKNPFLIFLQKKKWYIITVLWGLGLWLGIVGFSEYSVRLGVDHTWLDALYKTLQLVFFESGAVESPPLSLNIARFLLPFLTAQTSLMALAGIFTRQIRQFSLRWARNHIIVCGDDYLAFFAARAVMNSGEQVVFITASTDENEIHTIEELGGVVIKGHLADPVITKLIALKRAGYLLSFYDDDHENIENALLADRSADNRQTGTLKCITHLHDPLLSNLYLEQMLMAEWKQTVQHDVINIYEQAARQVLQKFPAIKPETIGKAASFLIIGFGKFGQHILLESARVLAASPEHGEINIHILDKEAGWKCTALHKRYPQLDKICCITAHEVDIFSTEFQDTEQFLKQNCPGVDQIYVCLNDDLQAINTALTIFRQLKETSPQIILRISEANGVKDLFHYGEIINKIHVVPIFREIGNPSVLLNSSVELLARAFHEHYLLQRLSEGAVGPAVMEWPDLDEEKKESNRKVALHLKRHINLLKYQLIPQQGLRTEPFSFTSAEIDFLAKMEHERWSAEMFARGWQHGPQNDPKKKTNPDLQPWERLSDAEKRFNRELIRIVPELVAKVRLQIVSRTEGAVESKELDQKIIRIGVGGHRFLDDATLVKFAIQDVLKRITAKHSGQTINLYTPLAPGADQLAGLAALEYSIPIVVLLPLEQKLYLEDFPIEDQDAFFRISAQAVEFICLNTAGDREESYRTLGSYMAAHMDYLIAIWNGWPERGPGGTGEVVKNFRQTGKPLAWIRADNMLPDHPVLLPASLKKGSISYENW